MSPDTESVYRPIRAARSSTIAFTNDYLALGSFVESELTTTSD